MKSITGMPVIILTTVYLVIFTVFFALQAE